MCRVFFGEITHFRFPQRCAGRQPLLAGLPGVRSLRRRAAIPLGNVARDLDVGNASCDIGRDTWQAILQTQGETRKWTASLGGISANATCSTFARTWSGQITMR